MSVSSNGRGAESPTPDGQDHIFGFDTLTLHAGQRPDPTTGARAVPIYQTTSYVFEDTDHAAELFNLQRFGNIYTRIMNPTTARIRGADGRRWKAVSARSRSAAGQAAQFVALARSSKPGDEIVAANDALWRHLYAVRRHLPPLRHRCRLRRSRRSRELPPRDHAATRVLYGETIGNPRINVLDIAGRGRYRPRARAAADHRQHLRHALSLPADRARRRYRGPLRHQVHRRARHLDRRRHRR